MENNWVIHTFSQRFAFLGIIFVKPIGLESVNIDYEVNKYFVDSWKESKKPWRVNETSYLDYFIEEEYLFKGHQLCIPRGSI